LSSVLYCTTISASVGTKGSDSDLASGHTMETILGIECDARHYGKHEHHPVPNTVCVLWPAVKRTAATTPVEQFRSHVMRLSLMDIEIAKVFRSDIWYVIPTNLPSQFPIKIAYARAKIIICNTFMQYLFSYNCNNLE